LALDMLEWGTIAIMGLAILIWGPEKVPEIAKTLAKARRDFEGYTKQFEGIGKELTNTVGTGDIDGLMGTLTGFAGESTEAAEASAVQEGPAAQVGAQGVAEVAAEVHDFSGDKLLVEMAKRLQISTQGKTRDQIQAEIIAKASRGPAVPVDATQVSPSQEAAEAPAGPETPAQEPSTAPAA